MATLLTITDILGFPPFNVFLCDETQTTCVYIAQINYSDVPYQFEPPLLLGSYTTFVVKVIDNISCVIISDTVSI